MKTIKIHTRIRIILATRKKTVPCDESSKMSFCLDSSKDLSELGKALPEAVWNFLNQAAN